MSEAKHTPGPWEVFDNGLIFVKKDGHPICGCGTSFVGGGGECADWQVERNKANANLIAAAPDLLDVAEHFCCHRNMDIIEGTCVFRCGRIKNGVCQQATDCWILKAIQKARGQV